MAYIGWELTEETRNILLEKFTPIYPDVIAHHITESSCKKDTPAPPEVNAAVIGIINDDAGVQALIVEINGSTIRKDGRTYHCTWSIDRSLGRKPVDSNTVIAEHGWFPVSRIEIEVIPKYFE